MTIRYIEDESVKEAIEDAAKAACQALDEHFPGGDGGGITSNFQGLLAEVIGHMLTGKSVLDAKRGHYVSLPKLVLDNHAFGERIPGDLFVVTMGDGYDWEMIDGVPNSKERIKVLNDATSGFVPLEDGEHVDPYTSFEAATHGAIEYLRSKGLSPGDANLSIKPVIMNDDGYEFV